ncbi:MAG: acyltransferase [Ktedonobacterales bacterium]
MVDVSARPMQAIGLAQRKSLRSLLLPANNGPQEILALDGLRAVAALSVVFFHTFFVVYSIAGQTVFFGYNTTYLWQYGQTGVHLFFILSGFLLFTPYAKAMLDGRPLPSAKRFFQRRALRILPAYWVCLALLVVLQLVTGTVSYLSTNGLLNIATHIVLFQDDFPSFNRLIEGPFWTLAVEAQFYLVLPLFAAAIARFVGRTQSRRRLIIGVLGVIVFALVLRMADAVAEGHAIATKGMSATMLSLFVRVTMGTQGKYLEVFALGMLCSVLYLIVNEESRRVRRAIHGVGTLLFLAAFPIAYICANIFLAVNIETPPYYILVHAKDLALICGPLLVGSGYAALVLGTLWAGGPIRRIFEFWPLRFVGLISYSLYLWHLPVITAFRPYILLLPSSLQVVGAIAVALGVALPIAYLSYQFVERPFLQRRHRMGAKVAVAAASA